MFGYITINKSEMKFKEFDVYHSYYCGLCKSLKEGYGGLGQLTLSYDMAFIAVLLSALYEPETQEKMFSCIAHPFEKHLTRTNEMTQYVADMNVLLTIYKCIDDWNDDRKLERKIFADMLRSCSKKRRKLYRQKEEFMRDTLAKMSELEKSNCVDLDRMSGMFGEIMSEIMVYREDEWKEVLGELGFYLGKFIYILDAYDDIEDDIKHNNYNPLKEQFGSKDFEDNIQLILTLMMSECCKRFEMLPIVENVEILRNILYSGVWGKYDMVKAKRNKVE